MEISNPQYQINMGCHQVEEIMLLAPNNKTSSSCSQETKKGGGGVRPQGQGGQAQLTCPRCESTNTKFCYYNNYSLSQPRYFCKSCRRYWTQGGSLRNVPVGGGCRKNAKRSSSSSSSSKILINNNNSNNNNNNSIINRPLVDHTLVPTSSNPNINPLQLLTLHDPTFLLPPNPNPNLLDILRGSANGFSSGLPNYGTSAGVDGGVGGTEGQQWQFGNNGRNVNVAVDMGTGNIVRDYNYNYNNWNDMNGAASSYWNGVINSSLM